LVSCLFKEHEVNEKNGTEQDGLGLHIQVLREGDTKVVRVGKSFASQARPLLADLADLGAVRGLDLKTRTE
jgi:hypothetical protein